MRTVALLAIAAVLFAFSGRSSGEEIAPKVMIEAAGQLEGIPPLSEEVTALSRLTRDTILVSRADGRKEVYRISGGKVSQQTALLLPEGSIVRCGRDDGVVWVYSYETEELRKAVYSPDTGRFTAEPAIKLTLSVADPSKSLQGWGVSGDVLHALYYVSTGDKETGFSFRNINLRTNEDQETLLPLTDGYSYSVISGEEGCVWTHKSDADGCEYVLSTSEGKRWSAHLGADSGYVQPCGKSVVFRKKGSEAITVHDMETGRDRKASLLPGDASDFGRPVDINETGILFLTGCERPLFAYFDGFRRLHAWQPDVIVGGRDCIVLGDGRYVLASRWGSLFLLDAAKRKATRLADSGYIQDGFPGYPNGWASRSQVYADRLYYLLDDGCTMAWHGLERAEAAHMATVPWDKRYVAMSASSEALVCLSADGRLHFLKGNEWSDARIPPDMLPLLSAFPAVYATTPTVYVTADLNRLGKVVICDMKSGKFGLTEFDARFGCLNNTVSYKKTDYTNCAILPDGTPVDFPRGYSDVDTSVWVSPDGEFTACGGCDYFAGRWRQQFSEYEGMKRIFTHILKAAPGYYVAYAHEKPPRVTLFKGESVVGDYPIHNVGEKISYAFYYGGAVYVLYVDGFLERLTVTEPEAGK
ncbi:MAG: hypothetical protein WC712_03900 [Candidatus Brocadiia bacterium]